MLNATLRIFLFILKLTAKFNLHIVFFYTEGDGVSTQKPIKLTISISPVIVETMSHLLVDGRHGLHVALPPLTPQVFGLHFEQFEDIELHHGLLDL